MSSYPKIHKKKFPHSNEIFQMLAKWQLNSTGCPRKIDTVRIRCEALHCVPEDMYPKLFAINVNS